MTALLAVPVPLIGLAGPPMDPRSVNVVVLVTSMIQLPFAFVLPCTPVMWTAWPVLKPCASTVATSLGTARVVVAIAITVGATPVTVAEPGAFLRSQYCPLP